MRTLGVAMLHAQDVTREVIERRALEGASQSWRKTPRTMTHQREVTLLNAEHFGGILGHIGRWKPSPIDPDDQVRQVSGYQIRLRSGGSFAVPLASALALYKVVRRGGSYRVCVRGADRQWSEHELPAAALAAAASVADGPAKEQALRDLLQVVPRFTQRARSTAERDGVQERFEQSATLYQASLFMRPEYQIKPEGGAHGPLTLAELLRDGSGSSYTVPGGPALIGGFSTSLLGSTLRMAGMIVTGDGGPSVFLYGHQRLQCSVGGITVEAEGDFVVAAGDAWTAIPLPTGAVAAAGAIGFSGHVLLRQGAAKLFEGSSSGSFTVGAGGRVQAALDVDVAAQGSLDLGIGETQFARIGWSFGGRVAVQVSPQQLSVSVAANAAVEAELATYATRWVVDVPAKTVCVPWYYVDSILPPAGHWGSACTRTPEVGHPEIDFKSVRWQPLAAASCDVSASVSNAALRFVLHLDALGGSALAAIGVDRIELDALA